MGYTLGDLAFARNCVLANGVALLLVFAVLNWQDRSITVRSSQLSVTILLDRRSRIQFQSVCWKLAVRSTGSESLVLLPNPAGFSILPPFFYGAHSAAFAWGVLILVLLVHIGCFVRSCDGQRSFWAYCYYIYHAGILAWLATALIIGYYLSQAQPQATDTNEH